MEYLVDTGDFHLAGLVVQETYKHTGFALTIELLFELSFDKNVLKNLCHWLGQQTIAKGILINLGTCTRGLQ